MRHKVVNGKKNNRSHLLRFLERVLEQPYQHKNLHLHRKGWRETLDACLATAQQPHTKRLIRGMHMHNKENTKYLVKKLVDTLGFS